MFRSSSFHLRHLFNFIWSSGLVSSVSSCCVVFICVVVVCVLFSAKKHTQKIFRRFLLTELNSFRCGRFYSSFTKTKKAKVKMNKKKKKTIIIKINRFGRARARIQNHERCMLQPAMIYFLFHFECDGARAHSRSTVSRLIKIESVDVTLK